MNYRHAYHAGNFADCFKHALLVELLDSIARKPKPFFVLDTHAGAGRYDLDDEAARRTAEANSGIFRLLERPSPILERYLGLVRNIGLYPGSPVLTRAVMRHGDRLVCCELQGDDAATLRGVFRHDPRVEVHERSGWEALNALLPPREKRGLLFVDPPFEATEEFSTLVDGFRCAHARFGHAVSAGWYPIKHMAPVRRFHAELASSGIRDVVTVELHLREPTNAGRLNGCGLIVINPPYQFEDQALSIATAILEGLGDDEAGKAAFVARLVDE
ncbi:23S rRNA (adenine(2030)-N(6))-methyltransferase RlmJ [Rhodopila sp.]|uniref:23S rRNA (adenine(2030)-N(6))-methyltransferase RlmJ n=1 Tax=Rhodopila sp. TaxID=2480087 RepID=UPI003D1199B3